MKATVAENLVSYFLTRNKTKAYLIFCIFLLTYHQYSAIVYLICELDDFRNIVLVLFEILKSFNFIAFLSLTFAFFFNIIWPFLS